MKYDARTLKTEEKHVLRKIVQRVLDGEPAIEVTRSLGLGVKTVFNWLKIHKTGGFSALSPMHVSYPALYRSPYHHGNDHQTKLVKISLM